MAEKGIKRSLKGTVVSDKMDKSIVVSVERQFAHAKYKKQIKRTSRYKAHDENNTAKLGDRVSILECRPLSKDKRWLLEEIIEKAV
jgi:small subunit ribosomal protein S17